MKAHKGAKPPAQVEHKAAVTIQRHWLGFVARRNYPKLLKRHRKKKFTALELVQSERTYCQNLEYIVSKVRKPSTILIEDKHLFKALFSNIDEILALHNHFLQELEGVMKDYNPHLTKLSGVLQAQLFHRDNFKPVYTKYCYDYKNTDQAIKMATEKNQFFSDHLKKLGLTSLNLSLESYMIKPVQRICKYKVIIEQYRKNMEEDHIDYKDILKTSLVIEKLVQETNDQVEEFLMRERFLELKNTFPSFFGALGKQPRMYYETKEISLLDIIQEEELGYRSLVLLDKSAVLIPFKITDEPIQFRFFFARELPNNKYYKNIVQLVGESYTYLQLRDEKDKKQLMRVLNQKLKQQSEEAYHDYIRITILGTETRESFFSSYTVYIANIEDRGKVSTIYPRFKDLLKVQDLMVDKGMKFQRLLLSKESIISTLKSKTIEKRKHTIQEFLEKVFNNCPYSELKEVEELLGCSQLGATAMMPRVSAEAEEVWVFLPNMQKVKVMISVNDSQIRDLKQLISDRMGMENTNQFEIFEVRNKNYASKKLLYEGEPVKKIFDEERDSLSSINPFRDTVDYIYTRHFYLSKQEEEELYKCDQARAELQVSVIHAEILSYRLEEEVMLTFMCLFAIYLHLPVENQERLGFYIREVTKKQYKVSEEEFRIYLGEVKRMLLGEDSLSTSLPLIIIKIVANSYLYQCLQFEVTVHHKIFASFKKVFTSLEENIILGLHPEVVYLLRPRDRTILGKFSYSQLSLVETRPNSIVLEVLHNQTPLILKSPIVFEISKIFQIYRGNH